MSNSADEPSKLRSFIRTSQLYFSFFKFVVTIPFQRETKLYDPQEVLRQTLGNDLEVLEFTTDKLVKFGDNYSSTIVKTTVDIKCNGHTERLNLVAKMLPPSEFLRKQMQLSVIMAKEIFFYEEVLPEYIKIGGRDFDIAPKFYGARKVDETAADNRVVLLLENLKENGYAMGERNNGLTLNHLKIAIPTIAKFHAIGFTIKKDNPELFTKIKNHATLFNIPADLFKLFVTKLQKQIKNNREMNIYYERVKKLEIVDSKGNYSLIHELDPENPYACLVHADLWINNMMFREIDGKIDGFKIFDFQVYNISSPITDMLYFLFTSLQQDFELFDEAMKLYRECMCDLLKKFGCNFNLFEEEAFKKRLKEDAKTELYRGLLMANNIEMRSKWDMMRISSYTVQRMKKILQLYESKGWFDS